MTVERTVELTPGQRFHKKVARVLIEAVGGVEAAAGYCRAGKSQLSDYCNPNVLAFMPIDVVADLEGLTGPHVTRFLAREAGFGIVALPDVGALPTDWSAHVACLMREAGQLVAALGAALAEDNDVRAREARAILSEAADLVRVAVELEDALKRRAGEVG